MIKKTCSLFLNHDIFVLLIKNYIFYNRKKEYWGYPIWYMVMYILDYVKSNTKSVDLILMIF